MLTDDKNKRIAVLIDADNVSHKYLKYIMDEISNYGTPTYKRIYGDWTKPNLSNWKNDLLNHSVTPIQQYNYTTGKNSTDASLIIDAMDILYSGNVDGFCLVSSDSDFTRLASRLREAGMTVLGMGEKKTPAPFISACNQFKYLEVLLVGPEGEQSGSAVKEGSDDSTDINKLTQTLKAIIPDLSDEDGWAHLSAVGNVLNRRLPDFDTRNFGYLKLSSFINSLNQFEVQIRKNPNSAQTLAYVRVKPARKNNNKKKTFF